MIRNLEERILFERPTTASNGAGGTVSGFEPAFTAWAEYIRLRAGETVMAGRQVGKRATVIRIHNQAAALAITEQWRATDTRTGETFDVHSAIPTDDRQWIEIDATGYRS